MTRYQALLNLLKHGELMLPEISKSWVAHVIHAPLLLHWLSDIDGFTAIGLARIRSIF
jgi:hypothetical protein